MRQARKMRGGVRPVYLLVMAAVFIVLSKLVVARFDDGGAQTKDGLVVDLFFEMASALIGALAGMRTVVLFLGRRPVRRFRKNLALRRRIERRTEALQDGESTAAKG